jgi:23S rRNA maturation-related 3'-5' exoribonuclease YhaM
MPLRKNKDGIKLIYKKKTISLEESIMDYAKDKADKLFSGNLAGYISYLISCDMQRITHVQTVNIAKDEISVTLDKEPEKRALSAIDMVMGFENP